jgi:hypothetical protein
MTNLQPQVNEKKSLPLLSHYIPTGKINMFVWIVLQSLGHSRLSMQSVD